MITECHVEPALLGERFDIVQIVLVVPSTKLSKGQCEFSEIHDYYLVILKGNIDCVFESTFRKESFVHITPFWKFFERVKTSLLLVPPKCNELDN